MMHKTFVLSHYWHLLPTSSFDDDDYSRSTVGNTRRSKHILGLYCLGLGYVIDELQMTWADIIASRGSNETTRVTVTTAEMQSANNCP